MTDEDLRTLVRFKLPPPSKDFQAVRAYLGDDSYGLLIPLVAWREDHTKALDRVADAVIGMFKQSHKRSSEY